MGYSREQFIEAVENYGEVFFVLDSGKEYIVHGKNGFELGGSTVRVDGLKDDEYIIAEFPLDAIEHHYSHREL